MKDTDDDKLVDGSDAGAVPATSTNTWADKPERLGQKLLGGRNVHGVLDKRPDWYYTQREWDRVVGWGKVPDERNTELRGVKQHRRTDETLSEESDTKT